MFTAFDRPQNLPDAIAQQIRQHILNGKLEEGTRLPTEHELMAKFNVSRNVVREAIAQLKLNGLVETRRGVGTFIANNITGRKFEIIKEDLLDIRQLEQLSQLRIEIEAGAAALAALNRTEQQLSDLERSLQHLNVRVGNWEDGAAAAMEFHMCIAQCSNNPYFIRLMEHLSYVLQNAVRTLRSRNQERSAQVDKEHQHIFEAIRLQDSEAARQAVRNHLQNGLNSYRNKQDEQTKNPSGSNL